MHDVIYKSTIETSDYIDGPNQSISGNTNVTVNLV
jgi:hypothetical protein